MNSIIYRQLMLLCRYKYNNSCRYRQEQDAISKVVRKPGLVVRKIEKVGRKSSNCRRFFRGTFHARGHFPGRSCLFPGDLPRWRPFSRKVLRFFGGPSTLEAIFPEGLAFFRGTFRPFRSKPERFCFFWERR